MKQRNLSVCKESGLKRKINKKISDPEKSRLFRAKFSVPEKIRQKNFSVPFSGG